MVDFFKGYKNEYILGVRMKYNEEEILKEIIEYIESPSLHINPNEINTPYYSYYPFFIIK